MSNLLPSIESKKITLNQKFSPLTPQNSKKVKFQVDSLNYSIDSKNNANPIKIPSNNNIYSKMNIGNNQKNNNSLNFKTEIKKFLPPTHSNSYSDNKLSETFGNFNINDKYSSNKKESKINTLNNSAINSFDKPIQGSIATSRALKKKKNIGKMIAPIDPNLYKVEMKDVIKRYEDIKQGNIRRLNKDGNLKLTASFQSKTNYNYFDQNYSDRDFVPGFNNESLILVNQANKNFNDLSLNNTNNDFIESSTHGNDFIRSSGNNNKFINLNNNCLNDHQQSNYLNRSFNDLSSLKNIKLRNDLNLINDLQQNRDKNSNINKNYYFQKHKDLEFDNNNSKGNIEKINSNKNNHNSYENQIKYFNGKTNKNILPMINSNHNLNIKDSLNISISEMDDRDYFQNIHLKTQENINSASIRETNGFSFKRTSFSNYPNQEEIQVLSMNLDKHSLENNQYDITNPNFNDFNNSSKDDADKKFINYSNINNNNFSIKLNENINSLNKYESISPNKNSLTINKLNNIERYNNDKIIKNRNYNNNFNKEERLNYLNIQNSDKNENRKNKINSSNLSSNSGIIPEKLFDVIESIEKENILIKRKLYEKTNSITRNIRSVSSEANEEQEEILNPNSNNFINNFQTIKVNNNLSNGPRFLSTNNKNNILNQNNPNEKNANPKAENGTEIDKTNKDYLKDIDKSKKSYNKPFHDNISNQRTIFYTNSQDLNNKVNDNLNTKISDNLVSQECFDVNKNKNNHILDFIDLNNKQIEKTFNNNSNMNNIEILSFSKTQENIDKILLSDTKNEILNSENNCEVSNEKNSYIPNIIIESKFESKKVFCIYCLRAAVKPIILSSCKHELCMECAKEYISIIDFLKNYDINHIKCPRCKKKSYIKDKINFEGNIDYTWVTSKNSGKFI